eukprot:1195890-Prorocentrum_minimum.AAC.2
MTQISYMPRVLRSIEIGRRTLVFRIEFGAEYSRYDNAKTCFTGTTWKILSTYEPNITHMLKTTETYTSLQPASYHTNHSPSTTRLDSVSVLELQKLLKSTLRVDVPVTAVFDYPTVEGLSQFIVNEGRINSSDPLDRRIDSSDRFDDLDRSSPGLPGTLWTPGATGIPGVISRHVTGDPGGNAGVDLIGAVRIGSVAARVSHHTNLGSLGASFGTPEGGRGEIRAGATEASRWGEDDAEIGIVQAAQASSVRSFKHRADVGKLGTLCEKLRSMETRLKDEAALRCSRCPISAPLVT